MPEYLIVAREGELKKYLDIAGKYSVGFEINDFYEPNLLDDEEKVEKCIQSYLQTGIMGKSTMHGAFYDIVPFSFDRKVKMVSLERMRQSMEIAERLGVKAVVFHTNYNPFLRNSEYRRTVVEETVKALEDLLTDYPGKRVYLENMFDDTPQILQEISARLCQYPNYGVCLDWAHVVLYSKERKEWVEQLGTYIRHVHLNDNDLINDRHWALGTGKIQWEEFYELFSMGLQPETILIEVNDPDDQVRSLEFLRDRWNAGRRTNMTDAQDLLNQIFYLMNELITEKDFDKTILLLTDLGRTLVNADRASFWYWDKQHKEYWTLAATESGKIVVPEASGIVGASISKGEPILINAPYEDARFNSEVDKKTGYHTKSILCIPVTDSKGNVIGAYQAINKLGEQEGFDASDISRLSLAAVYCGKMLESQLLTRESQTDRLTGLRNRNGFYEFMQKTGPGGIIMCDIDFFKKVNDTYGHNAGDAVLMHVAQLMKNMCGEQGEVFRWGGEEFLILLPDIDKEKAICFAESVREKIEKETCVFAGDAIPVTMSFGVNLVDMELEPEENVKCVDKLLYQAKETGRNKVVFE